MHASLRPEKPVGVLPLDLEHSTLDAGLLTVAEVENFDGEVPALRPASVQPHEHLGPVLRLGPTSSSADFDLGIAKIVGSAHQRLQLECVGLLADGEGLAGEFSYHVGVRIRFEERLHLQRTLRAGPQLVERVCPRSQGLDLPHHQLRALLVVPERALSHFLLVLAQLLSLAIEVKETSAIQPGARHPASAIWPAQTQPWRSRLRDEPLPAHGKRLSGTSVTYSCCTRPPRPADPKRSSFLRRARR